MWSFWEDVADVLLDRVLGHSKASGDALVRAALRQKLENFVLTRSEVGRSRHPTGTAIGRQYIY
jgi:hypothetical protein